MVAPTYFKFYQTVVGNGLARFCLYIIRFALRNTLPIIYYLLLITYYNRAAGTFVLRFALCALRLNRAAVLRFAFCTLRLNRAAGTLPINYYLLLITLTTDTTLHTPFYTSG